MPDEKIAQNAREQLEQRSYTKTRTQLADMFVQSLNEQQLPWHAVWGTAQQQNAVSGKAYHGINAMYLSLVAQRNGLADPRWCTFNQAKNEGWSVKKGCHGVPIELWMMRQKGTSKLFDIREAAAMVRRGEATDQDFMWYTRNFTVFNARDIEGIPPMPQRENNVDIDAIRVGRDTLLENMKVGFSIGGDGCFYSHGEDAIHMPEEQSFEDTYGYMCSFLHEAGHATGAESRLNRDISGVFGSPEYAKEELRAEIASAMTAQQLGIPMTEQRQAQQIDLHKAYIQSWAKAIQDAPQELFAAIKDAEQISDYLIEKGRYRALIEQREQQAIAAIAGKESTATNAKQRIQNETPDARKFTQEQYSAARAVRAIDYIQAQGYEVKKDGRYWHMTEHDSLVMDERGFFNWNSRGISGKALDFMVKVEGLPLAESVKTLATMNGVTSQHTAAIPRKLAAAPKAPPEETLIFSLPPRSSNTFKQLFGGLCYGRGLDKEIVSTLIQDNRLYQSEHNVEDKTYYNAVFVGLDKDGIARSAFQRGLATGSTFKREVAGSDKTVPFTMPGAAEQCDTLAIFEGAIDAVSHATWEKAHGAAWQQTARLATGGNAPAEGVIHYLQEHPEIHNIKFCFDNDDAGTRLESLLRERLSSANIKEPDYTFTQEKSPTGKDWNEHLTAETCREIPRQESPAAIPLKERMAVAQAEAERRNAARISDVSERQAPEHSHAKR